MRKRTVAPLRCCVTVDTAAEAAFRNAHRISPSQIDTAQLCLRKWGYLKLDKLQAPSNKSAQLGTDSHEVLEHWQRDGRAVDLTTDVGKIVSSGLKYLPQPGTLRTEHDFKYDTGKVVFQGRMDLRGQATDRVQTVWDHKTTSNFTWVKRPEVLRKDSQAVIYAQAALDEAYREGLQWGSTLERVELNWIYYLTNPNQPRSRKVQLHVVQNEHAPSPECPSNVQPEHFGVMALSELDERFAELESFSQQLLSYYKDKPRASELPYNAAACGAYGGCPFKDNPCKLTFKERWISMETENKVKTLTLAEKIRSRMGAAAPQPEPVQAAPAATAPVAMKVPLKLKAAEPMVNPPEKAQGVDPDAPATTSHTTDGVIQTTSNMGRVEIAALAMEGLVAARVYSVEDSRYAVKVAADAVKLADALLAQLAKA